MALVGTLGTLWLRGWGRVGFEVPSVPWYFSFPFYVFPDPQLEPGWAAAAIPVVAAAVAATLALYRSPVGWPWRVAASVGLAGVLALAVAILAGGPSAWGAPFDYAGEYPAGVGRVGAIPTFLREFPARLPELPSHATGHPAGAMVVYALVARVWSGLTGVAGDVPAAVAAVHGAYQAAPGSAGRSLGHWLAGDLLAFGGMLGVPLLAALAVRAAGVVRERAWASVDAAALATLLAAASWGFTKGEVERIFQFLVPVVLVPVVRQLLAWRVRPPVVVGLLLGQTLLVQVLFYTRW